MINLLLFDGDILIKRIEIKSFVHLSILFLIMVGLSACGSGPHQKTGFLTDYSKLSPSTYKDAKGAMVYVKENSLKNYDNFILSPVQIRLSKKGKERGVDRKKLRELAKYTNKQLRAELEKSGYSVVNQAGPGTLLFRGALTDIEPGVPLANIHPATSYPVSVLAEPRWNGNFKTP